MDECIGMDGPTGLASIESSYLESDVINQSRVHDTNPRCHDTQNRRFQRDLSQPLDAENCTFTGGLHVWVKRRPVGASDQSYPAD